MNSKFDVAIAKCETYKEDDINNALDVVLEACGGIDFIKPNMNVVIKANLVSAMHPDKAATTNPKLLLELSKRIIKKGANVTIGDSPGGPFNKVYLNQVYKITGLKELTEFGIKLNEDFEEERVDFPGGVKCKDFVMTSYLSKADIIIDCCKLKSHGMMSLSCAVKNLFGIIPGTLKTEFHYRFPDYNDFANMLIDLNEYLKPTLSIVDAVVAMEGNGPTAGTPRQVGLILASKNQYKLDYICAHIIGLEMANVPTIEESYKRNLISKDIKEISCNMNIDNLVIKDFDLRKIHTQVTFADDSKIVGKIAKRLLKSKPNVDSNKCIGCEKCKNVCPANAIQMKNKKPQINRKKCITCFCCQEFCPVGAMQVKRSKIARFLEKGK